MNETPTSKSLDLLRRHRRRACASLAAVCMLLFLRCAASPGAPPLLPPIAGDDFIVVAGERFHIGTRVVTWLEPDGYSAYREGKHFDRSEEPDGEKRYSARGDLPADLEDKPQLSLEDVQRVVDKFVVHYDVCGCSRQCFKVLQDVRTLSVHFMLDVDGTIYQTLDLREKAWHAKIANNHSVGVEIAHPGAYPQPLSAAMRVWYDKDEQGWFQRFPKWMTETGVRTEGFVPRPARPEPIGGEVQGKTYHMFDFTEQQYSALTRLLAGINRALPKIELDAPRDPHGEIVDRALPAEDLHAFEGVVGHYHVQTNKQDPGPAFQWERVLREARQLAEN